ncbi:MAG: alpha-amylase [Planctomycetaceae bacterium]|nr:MAG: alpha-amylase [Planctomycetaceae bacterium]
MSSGARLILTIHNHQPVGNFDHVIEAAFQQCYFPFLNVLKQYPQLPVVLHYSGSLFDWLRQHHPEFVEELFHLQASGQVELLAGPYYEPILPAIPQPDRMGQLVGYRCMLAQLSGHAINGLWIPERVWEPTLVSDLVRAGYRYTLLDDLHFLAAGLSTDQLWGYYLTENEGCLLYVFPGSEQLRYLIPYAEPSRILEYCRQIAEQHPEAVLVYGDDGEKFGSWPQSYHHVYEERWLHRFFEALCHQQGWLKTTTFAETISAVKPRGIIYIPEGSYREMTEWALLTERRSAYEELKQHLAAQPAGERWRSFLRAGSWRNFLAKYPEARDMYARMLQVSRRFQDVEQCWQHTTKPIAKSQPSPHLSSPQTSTRQAALAAAEIFEQLSAQVRRHLYRAQCNCPYWHGTFGGLYLPHLRQAVYRELILAERGLDRLSAPTKPVTLSTADFNADGLQEIQLRSDRLMAFVAPSQGGILYELDLCDTPHNLLASLNRRYEPYHDHCPASEHRMQENSPAEAPPSRREFLYDRWPRKALIDHFLQPGLSREEFSQGAGHVGDFTWGEYTPSLRSDERQVAVCLQRTGRLGPYEITVQKTITLDAQHRSLLAIHYRLEHLPPDLPIHFAIEFNLAGLAPEAEDRYFYDERGRSLGPLAQTRQLSRSTRLGVADEWLGLDLCWEWSIPTQLWIFPIHTVSQSEQGVEQLYQCTAVIPHWEFTAPTSGIWEVGIEWSFDTSAAHARRLAELPPTSTVRSPHFLRAHSPTLRAPLARRG